MTNTNDFPGSASAKQKSSTAEPLKPAAAAEQTIKGDAPKDVGAKSKADELLAEKKLTHEELLKEHGKTKKLLVEAQAKNKDLMEAVRYRDRKISKLGLGAAGTVGKVSGKDNTMDHSHLGEVAPVEASTQAKTAAPKTVKKPAAPKH